MRKIILASHGELAQGMLNSLSMIVGDMAEQLEAFCLYPGESAVDYANNQMKRITSNNDEFIYVSDIRGGSVHTALMELTAYPNVKLFSGMNMNLLLAIILSHSEWMDDKELDTLLADAKEGIDVMTQTRCEAYEDEDF